MLSGANEGWIHSDLERAATAACEALKEGMDGNAALNQCEVNGFR